MDSGARTVTRPSGDLGPALLPLVMTAHRDLMTGRGLAPARLAELGPMAVLAVDEAGWRPDALHNLRQFLVNALDTLASENRGSFVRPAPSVARVLRAAIGVDHYPVARDWAGLLAEPPVGEGTVRQWERACGTVLTDEISRWCDAAWEVIHGPVLRLPASPFPYTDGDSKDAWPPQLVRQAALTRTSERLRPLMEDLPELDEEPLWGLLRRTAADDAEHYLNLLRHPVTDAAVKTSTTGTNTAARYQNTAALRAYSHLHYNVAASWTAPGRTWLLNSHALPHLGRPSTYHGGGVHFRQATAAALSRALFGFITSDRLIEEVALHAMARFLEEGNAFAALTGPRRLTRTLTRYNPVMQRATATLLARTASTESARHPTIEPALSDDLVLFDDGDITADDMMREAMHIRAQRSNNEKSAFIEGYLRKRSRLGNPLALSAEEREAVALADHSVEWDAVCASGTVGRAVEQLNELHRILHRFPIPEHRGYDTHRFRGLAVSVNKRPDRQRLALQYAMAGVTRLAALRNTGQAGTALEVAESVHQHFLGLAGIWVTWLEHELQNPRRSRIPAWVLARHACYWSNATLQHLELLDQDHPLPDPGDGVRWKERRISTTRWRVQTRLIQARAQLASRLAIDSGLGTPKDFYGNRVQKAGEPIAPHNLAPESLAHSYIRILSLDEITERTDGPSLAQLALTIGFLDGGGVPTIRLEDMDVRKRIAIQKPLDFLFAPSDIINSSVQRYALPVTELQFERIGEYLRQRRWDANVLSKVPEPDGLHPPAPDSPGARVFRLLAERNTAYAAWRSQW